MSVLWRCFLLASMNMNMLSEHEILHFSVIYVSSVIFHPVPAPIPPPDSPLLPPLLHLLPSRFLTPFLFSFQCPSHYSIKTSFSTGTAYSRFSYPTSLCWLCFKFQSCRTSTRFKILVFDS